MATDLPTETKSPGFEPSDVSTKGFLYFLLITGIFLVITCIVMVGLVAHYTKTDVPHPVVAQPFFDFRPLAPPPRIQTAPLRDIVEYRRAQARFLNSSGWIDQNRGIVRIPINQAMELLLRQGLPIQNQNSVARANAVAVLDEGRAAQISPPKRSVNAKPK